MVETLAPHRTAGAELQLYEFWSFSAETTEGDMTWAAPSMRFCRSDTSFPSLRCIVCGTLVLLSLFGGASCIPVHSYIGDTETNSQTSGFQSHSSVNVVVDSVPGRRLLQNQESFLFTGCDCEAWLCNPGFYQLFLHEEGCWGCAPCPTTCEPGFYLGKPCNPFSSPCRPCTVCSETQAEVIQCGATSDAQCFDCSQCEPAGNATTITPNVECPESFDSTKSGTETPVGNNSVANNSVADNSVPVVVVYTPEEMVCRFCPVVPQGASRTGLFDAGSGQCGWQCDAGLALDANGECSCASGFLNKSTGTCQPCRECDDISVTQCNTTHDATCFDCLNPLQKKCEYNGTFDLMTGICGLECEEPEDGCAVLCEPGSVRPEGTNCSFPCEPCSVVLPENSHFTDGCDFGCKDKTFQARGKCVKCTVCAAGQYEFSACTLDTNTDCRLCPDQKIPPYSEYDGVYDSVDLRCTYKCKGSVPRTGKICKCAQGQFINSSIQCTACSECGPGTFAATACGLDHNAACLPCNVCPENSWLAKACTVSGDTECTVCRECGEGTFPTSSCSATADRECSNCTVCGPEQYQASPCNPFVIGANRVCEICSTCAAGEYVNQSCGLMENTDCKPCQNAKPDGSDWTGQFDGGQCDWECLNNFEREQLANGSWSCTVCREGYYLNNLTCVACSTCPVGEEVAANCNRTQNTKCNPCTKPNTAFFDPLPDHSCTWQCNTGWFRQNDSCTACSEAKAMVANSVYTGVYNATLHECEWHCAVGFSGKERGECDCNSGYFDTAMQTCTPCGECDPETQIIFAECNSKNQTQCIRCPNQKPASSRFTGVFDHSADACLWECVSGWTLHTANLLAPLEEQIQNASNLSNASSVLQCSQCSVCSLGKYDAKHCSVTEDTHCKVCPNALPAYAHWTGFYDAKAKECTWGCMPNASAASGLCECISGFRLLDGRCELCEKCPLGLRELVACNEANETVCTPCANALPSDAKFDGGYDPVTDQCSWMCMRGWSLFRTNITVTPPPVEPVVVVVHMDHNTSTTPPVMTTPRPMEVWVESCLECMECQPGEYVKQECQPTQDTVCEVCPNSKPPRARFTKVFMDGSCEWECPDPAVCFCGTGSFWDQNFSAGECRECSECPPGMYMTVDCQYEADTICEVCPNRLPPHEVYTGEYRPDFKKCMTDCYEGWERYDPFAPDPTPAPGTTPEPGNWSLGNATNATTTTTSMMITTPQPGPLPILRASPYNESHPAPCICRESKIETPDGDCNFCRQCSPGTLVDKPCNATGNKDTGCKSCSNTKPVSSSWVPSLNGTAIAFDGGCDWDCWDGLTQLTRDGETTCRCLGTPGSCGYCPMVPGNATTVGSWCTAFQVFFDGSCRAKANAGLILNVIFTFGDWNLDGFSNKRVAFKSVLAGVLGASESKITVDIKNVKRLLAEHEMKPSRESAHLLALPQRQQAGSQGRVALRATPLTVPTFLDQVSFTSMLGMIASPDVLNAQLAGQGIPPVTGIMIGNSTTLDLTPREVPLNDTNVTAPFEIDTDTVATPMALILGLAGGFFGLCLCSLVGYGLYKAKQGVEKAGTDCYAYAKRVEEADFEVETSPAALGFVKKKGKKEKAAPTEEETAPK